MRAFSSLATKRAKAIVRAITDYDDAAVLAEVSEGLGEEMVEHQLWKHGARREDGR
jgi:pyridoxal biosynthesis lyase PdxS